jgi:deoxyribodipyrimidine photolyase-related protein
MSQHADGGVVGTKPYAASGAYINRMSNYCKDCQYDVKSRTGQDACPFNTLYWHFLIRNRDRLGSNQRMALVMKNLESMDEHEQVTITREGDALRRRFGVTSS